MGIVLLVFVPEPKREKKDKVESLKDIFVIPLKKYWKILCNLSALMFLTAVFFREYGINTKALFEQSYFNVYGNDRVKFYSSFMTFTSLPGTLLGNVLQSYIVEKFGPKYVLTLPILLIGKAVSDIICYYGTYGQQSSFTISLIFNVLTSVLGNGWSVPSYLIL
jgi:Na+/melibiose symporter-like transporter